MKIFKKISSLHLIVVWFFTIFFWTIYRILFVYPEWVEELIFKPVIYLAPVFLYLKIRRLNRKILGLQVKSWKLTLLWGLVVSLFLIAVNLIIWQFKGYGINRSLLYPEFIFSTLMVATVTAVSEEILYRGFLLNHFTNLLKENSANLLVSFLFIISHLPMALFILGYQGADFYSYLLLIFILSFVNGIAFQKTGNVITPIIIHALWNYSVMFINI
jgi:membrane protease YdiL (CAAX protease family)